MGRDAASGPVAMQPAGISNAAHDAAIDDELSDDALTGSYRILQRKKGHRYSLDDVLTAYQAARITPAPQRYLDLGCGIGSVLLMVAYKHPNARIEGIEAQAQSFALATRNVARNEQDHRVTLHHGDLRDLPLLDRLRGPFDLITGTPPYQPPGAGTPSPDSQRAHARVELRGGVEVYLEAGARLLSPAGHLVVCGDARAPQRVIDTAARLELSIVERVDAIPYASRKGALFSVWTLRRGETSAATPSLPYAHRTFYARNLDGSRADDAHELRAYFDLPSNPREAPSPPQHSAAPKGTPQ